MANAQMKIESGIGILFIIASEKGLKGVFWDKQEAPMASCESQEAAILQQAEREIAEYLAGKRKSFDVALDADGTDFQKKVWARLSEIPYGETRSYKEIAVELNDPNASRAVGTANGQNPLCIVVPCHRVISSDGSMGGYSGGLERKEKLLSLEKNGRLQWKRPRGVPPLRILHEGGIPEVENEA